MRSELPDPLDLIGQSNFVKSLHRSLVQCFAKALLASATTNPVGYPTARAKSRPVGRMEAYNGRRACENDESKDEYPYGQVGHTQKGDERKSRWVARGFQQRKVKSNSLLRLSTKTTLSTSFQPFSMENSNRTTISSTKVLRLNPCMVQSRHQINLWLKSVGFASTADTCLYIRKQGENTSHSLINRQHLNEFKSLLNKEFECKDNGPIASFLGMQTKSGTSTCHTALL